MKLNLLIFFFFATAFGIYGQYLKKFTFSPTVGIRMFNSEFESPDFTQAIEIRLSPSFGIDIRHKKKPFSLSLYFDRGLYGVFIPDSTITTKTYTNLTHRIRGNMISLLYHRKMSIFGIGHYGYYHESPLDFFFYSLSRNVRYVNLSYAIRLGNAEIGFIKLFRYSKFFAVRGLPLSSLNIKYHIQNKTTAQPPRDKYAQRFHFKLGVRTFMITNNYLLGEEKRRFGVSGSLGAEYLLPRFHTAAFAERDWWFGLNGGSPERQINGYVSNSILGVRFYYGKKLDWNIALGYAAVTDNNLLPITRPQILAGTAKVRLWYYNVKGVSVGFGKKVSPNCVLDLRGIIPYRGEYKFNKMRYSFGANYLLRV
jgi:hypothetical protein